MRQQIWKSFDLPTATKDGCISDFVNPESSTAPTAMDADLALAGFTRRALADHWICWVAAAGDVPKMGCPLSTEEVPLIAQT